MKENKNVWFYILGLLSGLLFIPIIEDFINVIMSWIQVLLLKPTKKVLNGNKEISELQVDELPKADCIGFQIPENEFDDYYDE